MGEIKINSSELDLRISDLVALRTKFQNLKVTDVETQGGGASAAEMECIQESFKDLYDAVSLLLDNSISFFQNVAVSYKNNDQFAADQISKNE